MADSDQLKNNENIYQQAENNYNNMKKDVIKFCLDLGWGVWIGDKIKNDLKEDNGGASE